MRFPTLACGAAFALTSFRFGQAQEPKKDAPEGKIITTADMREMAAKDYREADAQLNAAFKKLLARLEDDAQRFRLREVQKAWLKYRDLNAAFEASFSEGGSIQPQLHTMSLTAMTMNRTKELQSILNENFDH